MDRDQLCAAAGRLLAARRTHGRSARAPPRPHERSRPLHRRIARGWIRRHGRRRHRCPRRAGLRCRADGARGPVDLGSDLRRGRRAQPGARHLRCRRRDVGVDRRHRQRPVDRWTRMALGLLHQRAHRHRAAGARRLAAPPRRRARPLPSVRRRGRRHGDRRLAGPGLRPEPRRRRRLGRDLDPAALRARRRAAGQLRARRATGTRAARARLGPARALASRLERDGVLRLRCLLHVHLPRVTVHAAGARVLADGDGARVARNLGDRVRLRRDHGSTARQHLRHSHAAAGRDGLSSSRPGSCSSTPRPTPTM